MLEAVTVFIITAYSVVVVLQVFFRYALNSSLIWAEEAVRFGLLWGVMLGAAVASDQNAHIVLDPLRDAFGPKGRRVLAWISGVLTIVFCAVITWYGLQYASRVRFMSSPAADFPMMYVYGAIPVGATFIAFFVIIHLLSGTESHRDSTAAEL